MREVDSIKAAFSSGSGFSANELVITAFALFFGVFLLFGIVTVFKNLKKFKSEDDSSELIIQTMFLVFSFVLFVIFTSLLII